MTIPINRDLHALQALRAAVTHEELARSANESSSAKSNAIRDGLDPRDRQDPTVELAHRIRAIRHGDPDRRRRAFRAFLETKLQGSFGEAVMKEGAIQGHLDRVQAALESNPALSGALDKAVDLLLDIADGRASGDVLRSLL